MTAIRPENKDTLKWNVNKQIDKHTEINAFLKFIAS